MKFPRARRLDAEINLIPMIDVLLVILIYLLMQSAAGDKRSALGINLPTASAQPPATLAAEIAVVVAASGEVFIDGEPFGDASADALSVRMATSAQAVPPPSLIIRADADARHQRVIDVMEAASRAGLAAVTFEAAQAAPVP